MGNLSVFVVLAGLWVLISPARVHAEKTSIALASTNAADIDAMLASFVARSKLPALAVAVIAEGKLVATNAFGVRRLGSTNRVTIHDKFHIGSVTKSMTATVAAALVEQGKLSWTTTIGDMFSDRLDQINTNYHTVTLEQLLSHQGGLPATPPFRALGKAFKSTNAPVEARREFVEAVLAGKPKYTPGTEHLYSNSGYCVAGVMLEKASGMPWEDMIRTMLFKPLEMESAGFGAPSSLGKIDQPWGHREGWFSPDPVPPGPRADNPAAFGPAGTVHCSIPDLAKYAAVHLAGARGESAFLKPDTFRKLHTPMINRYALGWVNISKHPVDDFVLWHNGSNTMFLVELWIVPKKNFVVVIASNAATYYVAERTFKEVVRELMKAFLN